MRRFVILVCSVLLALCALSAWPEEARALTAQDVAKGMEELQKTFPNGKYWNHVGGLNNPGGWTESPCTHHNNCGLYPNQCDCNSYRSAIQCHGFAKKLMSELYGEVPPGLADEVYGKDSGNFTWSQDITKAKMGDLLRLDYGKYNHSMVVTGVTDTHITVVECNYGGSCEIAWGRTFSKASVKDKVINLWHYKYEEEKPSGEKSSDRTQPGSSSSAPTVYMADDKHGYGVNDRFPVGAYASPSAFGVLGNDQISHISVPSGLGVIAYEDDQFRGDVLRLSPGTYNLEENGWSNRISSFKVVPEGDLNRNDNGNVSQQEQYADFFASNDYQRPLGRLSPGFYPDMSALGLIEWVEGSIDLTNVDIYFYRDYWYKQGVQHAYDDGYDQPSTVPIRGAKSFVIVPRGQGAPSGLPTEAPTPTAKPTPKPTAKPTPTPETAPSTGKLQQICGSDPLFELSWRTLSQDGICIRFHLLDQDGSSPYGSLLATQPGTWLSDLYRSYDDESSYGQYMGIIPELWMSDSDVCDRINQSLWAHIGLSDFRSAMLGGENPYNCEWWYFDSKACVIDHVVGFYVEHIMGGSGAIFRRAYYYDLRTGNEITPNLEAQGQPFLVACNDAMNRFLASHDADCNIQYRGDDSFLWMLPHCVWIYPSNGALHVEISYDSEPVGCLDAVTEIDYNATLLLGGALSALPSETDGGAEPTPKADDAVNSSEWKALYRTFLMTHETAIDNPEPYDRDERYIYSVGFRDYSGDGIPEMILWSVGYTDDTYDIYTIVNGRVAHCRANDSRAFLNGTNGTMEQYLDRETGQITWMIISEFYGEVSPDEFRRICIERYCFYSNQDVVSADVKALVWDNLWSDNEYRDEQEQPISQAEWEQRLQFYQTNFVRLTEPVLYTALRDSNPMNGCPPLDTAAVEQALNGWDPARDQPDMSRK